MKKEKNTQLALRLDRSSCGQLALSETWALRKQDEYAINLRRTAVEMPSPSDHSRSTGPLRLATEVNGDFKGAQRANRRPTGRHLSGGTDRRGSKIIAAEGRAFRNTVMCGGYNYEEEKC